MSIEVVEISDNNNPSVNFGVGVDLLMNEKKKQSTPKSLSINNKSNYISTKESSIGDIDKLEEELNNLTSSSSSSGSSSSSCTSSS